MKMTPRVPVVCRTEGFRIAVHSSSKQKNLPPLNIDLPIHKIKRWLIHGRYINAVADIVCVRRNLVNRYDTLYTVLVVSRSEDFRIAVHSRSKQKNLPPLNINLPVDKIKRWLIHGRSINAVADIVCVSPERV